MLSTKIFILFKQIHISKKYFSSDGSNKFEISNIFSGVLDNKKKLLLSNDYKMTQIINDAKNLDVKLQLYYTYNDKVLYDSLDYPGINIYKKNIDGFNGDLECKLTHLTARFSSYTTFMHLINKKLAISNEIAYHTKSIPKYNWLSEFDSHKMTIFHYICRKEIPENLIQYILFYKKYNENLFIEHDGNSNLPILHILKNKNTNRKILHFLIDNDVNFHVFNNRDIFYVPHIIWEKYVGKRLAKFIHGKIEKI